MTIPVIIDVFVVVFLVAFTIYGAKRGLLRALAGLVILVVALVGAGMIAATFAAPVTQIVSPLVERELSEKAEAIVAEQFAAVAQENVDERNPTLDDISIQELLERLGVREETWNSAKERLQIDEVGSAVTDAVLGAAVESFVYSMVYGILYILAFLLLLLLLHVLLGAMGLAMKLPGLHTLNALGGGLLGLVEGALLLFLAVWIGRKMGASFEHELLAEAHILRIFTTHTPLSVLAFLQ